jgi:hypothetical protein
MSEIHILDRQVRPESLCGYAGDPGEGDPTCGACIAVDEHLVFPSKRMDRVRDVVLPALALIAGLAMGLMALAGAPGLALRTGVVAGVVVMAVWPVSLVIEYLQLRRRRGELVVVEG